MLRLVIVADEAEGVGELSSELAERGLICSIASNGGLTSGELNWLAPDLVLLATSGPQKGADAKHLVQRVKQARNLPVIALVSKEALADLAPDVAVDDFVIEPWDAAEVALRAERAVWRTRRMASEETIKCGDLAVDLDNCEVTIAGRLVTLTFREYELLKFLAKNPGKVFTREALLNRVWGYDYYGGDRTVDVHIRRLRGKIEDSTHTFIETVRNMGYRFKKDG